MKRPNALIALMVMILNTLHAQNFQNNKWPRMEDPSAHNWDLAKMDTFRDYVIDSTKITGLVVVHNGELVFEYGDIVENSYIASCKKSVLAMLYGKYVENGTINLNKTVKQLQLDDVKGILPKEQEATIQDLISARSGVYHPEGYPGGMQQYAPKRGTVEPGSYWLYSNWDFNVAGYVFEKETGKNIYGEVESQIALPLAMQDWDRNLQVKQGDTTISKYLAYPMWFSTRDMARIGLLMLNEGNWDGKQLISKEWVGEMLKQRTTYKEIDKNVPSFRELDVSFGYGYMWWLFENSDDLRFKGAYVALGAMGQAIAVYPEIDVVVAYKTKAAYRRRNSMATRTTVLKRAVEMHNVK